jgi:hypothetical protein
LADRQIRSGVNGIQNPLPSHIAETEQHNEALVSSVVGIWMSLQNDASERIPIWRQIRRLSDTREHSG